MGLTFSRLVSRKPYVAGSEAILKAAPTAEQAALIDKLAVFHEPKVAAAVYAVLDKYADALDVESLIAALATGNTDNVMAVVDTAMKAVEGAMAGKLADSLQDAVWATGAVALAAPNTAPTLKGVSFHFNRVNPVLGDWLSHYDLHLIQQINDTTKEAVRAVLLDNVTAGKSPIAMAKTIKESVGLTKRQTAAVQNFRKELETFHLKRSAAGWGLGTGPDKVNGHNVFKPGPDGDPLDGVLNRRLRDLRYDKALIKAMQTKTPLKPDQIDKMVEAYARKYRRHRAMTIARTETMRAANVGVQEAFRQAIEKGVLSENLVRRRWIVTKDERTCKICAPIPVMNPELGVKFAEPFATPDGPVMLGPVHPACRCTIFIYLIEPWQAAAA